jgi:hypothetical protein
MSAFPAWEAHVMTTNEGLEASGFGQPPGGGGFGQPPGGGGFGQPPGSGGFGQPPGGGGFGPPPGGFDNAPNPHAAGKAKAPAIALIVVNVLGILLALFGIASNALLLVTGDSMGGGYDSYGGGYQASADPTVNAAIGIAQGVFGLFCGGFIIFGLVRMMQGRSWGIALAAVIMNMLPCTGPCCCLGLFVGIWGLIVLFDSEVKASFT